MRPATSGAPGREGRPAAARGTSWDASARPRRFALPVAVDECDRNRSASPDWMAAGLVAAMTTIACEARVLAEIARSACEQSAAGP